MIIYCKPFVFVLLSVKLVYLVLCARMCMVFFLLQVLMFLIFFYLFPQYIIGFCCDLHGPNIPASVPKSLNWIFNFEFSTVILWSHVLCLSFCISHAMLIAFRYCFSKALISCSVIVEALKVDSLQKLCSSLEPILRRVVR